LLPYVQNVASTHFITFPQLGQKQGSLEDAVSNKSLIA